MRYSTGFTISVFSIAFLASTLSATLAHAQTSFDVLAQDTCQQAVEKQIKTGHSTATNIGYDRAKSAQTEYVTSVKGSGHFDGDHGATKFSYSCNYDIRSGDASGVQVHMGNETAAAAN